MKKETALSLLRTICTGLSAFVVTKHFMGHEVDMIEWQGWVGLIVGTISTVWGIVDKTASIEGVQSALRSIIIMVGGILVAKGTLSTDQLTSILGLAMALIPFLYSTLSKQKSAAIVSGAISVNQLK